MKRYFGENKKGERKASKAALDLYNKPGGST